jgi:hypothetical protein
MRGGGRPSQAGKRAGWCGPERSDYTAAVFRPKGMALTAWGPQAPAKNGSQTPTSRKRAYGRERQRRPFASPETGKKAAAGA